MVGTERVKNRGRVSRFGNPGMSRMTLWLAGAVIVLLVALPSVASGKRRGGSTTEPAWNEPWLPAATGGGESRLYDAPTWQSGVRNGDGNAVIAPHGMTRAISAGRVWTRLSRARWLPGLVKQP